MPFTSMMLSPTCSLNHIALSLIISVSCMEPLITLLSLEVEDHVIQVLSHQEGSSHIWPFAVRIQAYANRKPSFVYCHDFHSCTMFHNFLPPSISQKSFYPFRKVFSRHAPKRCNVWVWVSLSSNDWLTRWCGQLYEWDLDLWVSAKNSAIILLHVLVPWV